MEAIIGKSELVQLAHKLDIIAKNEHESPWFQRHIITKAVLYVFC